jgi:transposase
MKQQGAQSWTYWTLGVDEGEERHRFVTLDEDGERVPRLSIWVNNRADHIEEGLAKVLLKLPAGYRLRIAVESLRSIGGVLARQAIALGCEMWQVNPKALRHYRDLEGQPRKDDDIDAFLAARMVYYGMKGCHLALDVKPEERSLCRLARLHTQLTRQKTAISTMFRSRLLELCPEVLCKGWEGPAYNTKAMAAVLKRWPGFEGLEKTKLSAVERVLMRVGYRSDEVAHRKAITLKEMAKRIAMPREERKVLAMELAVHLTQLQVMMKSLEEVDAEILARVRKHEIASKLLAMPGVGPFVAAVLVGEILPLARNLSEGKVATYAGVTPLSRKTGKDRSNKPSKLARGINKHVIHALYMSATSARNVSAIDAEYYRKQREIHQGHPKPHAAASISLARQRFKLMYKLLTTDAEYDKEILIARHFERQNRARAKAA